MANTLRDGGAVVVVASTLSQATAMRIMPTSYGRGFRLAHRVILPILGRSVRAITTVSELSRTHLDAYDVAAAAKVTVTYSGADHASEWNAGRACLTLDGKRPFVLV